MVNCNILSVAEKPSVAKELAAIIGRVSPDSIRRAGFSPFNPVFDIKNCLFKNQTAIMSMTSVSGHMMEIEFDQAFQNWHACSPLDLFNASIHKKVKSENDAIKRTLMAEAKKCNVLLLWLDCDMEGENIAYEVIEVCTQANPRLDIYRARFSALIERDIFRTMANPERPNPHLNDAVETRQEIDLRIGAAFTRFQTLRLQKRFENVPKSVISYGPCQFPTLGFVVERYLTIQSFISEKFWYITCEGEFDNPDNPSVKMKLNFNWNRHHIYDKFSAVIIYESCIENGGLATVIKCNEKPTSRRRPIPLNTIDFQVLASRQLKMGSERAMAVAESLYQRGILSYPRTETNYFKDGFELNALINDHRSHSIWGNYASQLLDLGKFEWPRTGGKDDQAHPPIHPTKSVELTMLDNDEEKNVYELVVRHFLACCSKDARGSQTSIAIAIPEGGETFSASGLMIYERNYLDIYGKYDHWNAIKVPVFNVGDTFTPKKIMLSEGSTTAPEPISESDLITIMDKKGIGTDATIATHISTIQTREYAIKDAYNRFSPTNLGLALVEGYNSMGYQLNKPELRAAIELDVQLVAKGEKTKEAAVSECLTTMRECFIACLKEAQKLDLAVQKYFQGIGGGDEARYQILNRNISSCGVCHDAMELRVQRNISGAEKGEPNRLVYCVTCAKGLVVPPKGELLQHELSCPLCGYQVLIVRSPETNKEHTICPYCFSNPPPPPNGQVGAYDFRCFMCANENCDLSGRTGGSDIDISPCYISACSGAIKLKKNQKGYVCSCSVSACKAVWWLPKCIKSATVTADTCAKCQASVGVKVNKLAFKFILSKAPMGIPPELTTCPCCDSIWETFGMNRLATKRRTGPLVAETNLVVNTHRTSSLAQVVEMPVLHQAQAPFQQSESERKSSSSLPATNVYDAALSGRSDKVRINQMPERNWPTRDISNTTYHSKPLQQQQQQADESSPICQCGQRTVVRTVSKEGKNKGRTFFVCPVRSTENCYFKFTDEIMRPEGGSLRSAGASSSSSAAMASFSSSGDWQARPANAQSSVAGILCKCGEPAQLKTTIKEGPNKGRQFFACAKNKDDFRNCEFFQWEDAAPVGNNNVSNLRGNQASNTGVICTRCRQTGHFARSCLNV